jgi:hypothetical protein
VKEWNGPALDALTAAKHAPAESNSPIKWSVPCVMFVGDLPGFWSGLMRFWPRNICHEHIFVLGKVTTFTIFPRAHAGSHYFPCTETSTKSVVSLPKKKLSSGAPREAFLGARLKRRAGDGMRSKMLVYSGKTCRESADTRHSGHKC